MDGPPAGDRSTRDAEQELWKRFSTARSAFDKARRAHFATLDATRKEASAVKEGIIAQAEELSTCTDWGDTARAYRDLMDQWKAAPRAGRADEDALWSRFRAAQDAFFEARSAAHAERDEDQRDNLRAKEALATEAEALLPIRDLGCQALGPARPSPSGGPQSGTCRGPTGTASRAGCARSRMQCTATSRISGGAPTPRSGRWPSPPWPRSAIPLAKIEEEAAAAAAAGNERAAADLTSRVEQTQCAARGRGELAGRVLRLTAGACRGEGGGTSHPTAPGRPYTR